MNIKTIDINALEWFDKINGNSYFAGNIILNYGLPDEKHYIMPYEYGYGEHYIDGAFSLLIKINVISDHEKYSNGGQEAIWKYCQRKGIILRTNKQKNCKKRELLNI